MMETMKLKKKEIDLTEFARKEAELDVLKTLYEYCMKQAICYAYDENNGELEFRKEDDYLRYEAFNNYAEKLMKEATK